MDDIQAENYVVKKIDALLANVDRYELKQVLSHKNKNNDPLFSLMFYGNSHKVEDFILNKIKNYDIILIFKAVSVFIYSQLTALPLPWELFLL